LLEAIHPLLAKKRPGYDAIATLMKVREDLFTAGIRPRIATPMLLAILDKLKDREQASVLSKLGYKSSEVHAILAFPKEALDSQRELTGKKTQEPAAAFRYLEKLPTEQTAYLMAESNNSAAISKIRAYFNKWRPIRLALPAVANELQALGMPLGDKFDAIVEAVFAMQLSGRGKTPEERIKMLRKLSGIKEQPKKKEKEKKSAKGAAEKRVSANDAGAKQSHAAAAAKITQRQNQKEESRKQKPKHAAPSHGKNKKQKHAKPKRK
jgi:hypothetical protein